MKIAINEFQNSLFHFH